MHLTAQVRFTGRYARLLKATNSVDAVKCRRPSNTRLCKNGQYDLCSFQYTLRDLLSLANVPELARLGRLKLGEPLRHILLGVQGDLDKRRRALLVVVGVPEGKRRAELARSPRAADAVDIRLDVARHIEVDHVGHAANVEAACRNVSRDHQRALVGDEGAERTLALVLSLVAVDGARAKLAKVLGELLNASLRVGEDDHARALLELAQVLVQLGVLLVVGCMDERLRDGGVCAELDVVAAADVDLRGGDARAQVGRGELAHCLRPRRAEEQRLARRRHLAKHRIDLCLEAHVEQPVGLVEGHRLAPRQREGALRLQVDEATWSSHKHCRRLRDQSSTLR
mmetsp:Transcript_41335/g.86580  ORF Transcript_41335/g.86580 Transcript_41335/m.86580 type:complete len:340 (+) Transcript_41335:321-1340(+)